MADSVPDAPPPNTPKHDRLDSWKEIAAYLNRDVTTVQRWEKREGMPVHRHLHGRLGSVYASRAELDAWARTRNLSRPPHDFANPDPPAAGSARPHLASRLKFLSAIAAIVLVCCLVGLLYLRKIDYFWENPIANARFQTVTDFDGLAEAGAISRDGHFVAFLSDRDGQTDVWVTQLGSGQFHNLTHGTLPGLSNPSLRSPGFTTDGSSVTFWVRKLDLSGGSDISIWAAPTLGGQPRPYLQGIAECDWSADASRLVYHTPASGDPLSVAESSQPASARTIFTAPAGLHNHFLTWAPDSSFIYFVHGTLPDKLDIWRITLSGGAPERITSHNSRVSHPVLLNRHILIYLATDSDLSGPWLYGMDVDRRIPHRLRSGPDRYTSLAASSDGHRLVATLANPKRTLWRLPLDLSGAPSAPTRISVATTTAFSPRLGPGFLLYVSSAANALSIWKVADASASELWRGQEAQFLAGPAISRDGKLLAVSVRQRGKSLMYVMRTDGTDARVVSDSLLLEGEPAWAPDGQSITSAADDSGSPHLYKIPLGGGAAPAPFIRDYSVDPVWSPDGSFLVYSGADIGTTFPVKAIAANAEPRRLPELTLTRGARRLAFLPGGHTLVLLRGEIQHKDLWRVDLDTGNERQLTRFDLDFDVRDFDISPDGLSVVLERLQNRSDIVLLDLPR